MEQVHYNSQFIKIISFTVKVLAGQGTLMSLVSFARDARESSIIFRANERIYTHGRGWVSLSALNAIAVHDKMLPLGNR